MTLTDLLSATPSAATERWAKGVLGASTLLFLVLLASPASGTLRLLYPAGAAVVGAFLLRAWPTGFTAFTFWLWILSPLLRRLVDYRNGYVDPSTILLAPLLVMCLVVPQALRHVNRHWSTSALPFALTLAALSIGFVSGFLHHWYSQQILKDTAVWAIPCLWGSFLASRNDSSKLANVFAQQCIWAVLVLGAYGTYQFLTAPAWDSTWLTSLLDEHVPFSGYNSFGEPEPLKIRVWSTLNSPGVFAVAMACCLLVLLSSKSKLRIPAALLGVLSLLFSAVRISWIALAAGIVLLFFAGAPYRKTLALMAGLCALSLLPIMAIPEISEPVLTRFQSFSHLSEDGSLNERANMHEALLGFIAKNPVGVGLGSPESFEGLSLDSGIFDVPYFFGWLGALFIGMAFCDLLVRMLSFWSQDGVMLGFKLVFVCVVVHLPAGDYTIGAPAFFLWSAVGFLLAAQRRTGSAASLPTAELALDSPLVAAPS